MPSEPSQPQLGPDRPHGPERPDRQERLDSTDILRSVAIVLMVVVHFVENLAGRHGGTDPFAAGYRAVWLPTGFAAPIFTFLTGLNYRLWQESLAARGVPQERICKITIRRGLFLLGLGFAFNVLVWLPEDTFNWDILTFIGTALIALELVRGMPPPVPLVGCGLVLAAAPVLRRIADYPAYWEGGWFDYDWTLADVTLGFLVVGYFPVFPWIVFPVAGFMATGWILPGRTQQTQGASAGGHASRLWPNRLPHVRDDVPGAEHPRKPEVFVPGKSLGGLFPRTASALVAGAACLATSAAVLAVRPLLPDRLAAGIAGGWTMFPASTAYLLGTLGLVLVATTLLHRAVDGRTGPRLTRWTRPLSRHALSVYLLHHVVHVWPMWIAGLATRGDADALWQVAVSPLTAFLLAIAFLVAAALLFDQVDRRKLPSAESVMRWLCD
jgi:uncharacterized membrane protein